MSESPASRPLSRRVLHQLTSELARLRGPKNIALIGEDSTAVEHTLDLLGPRDTLSVWPASDHARERMHQRVSTRSRFVAERVSIYEDQPSEAEVSTDIALSTTLLEDADAVEIFTHQASSVLREGGVISFASRVRGLTENVIRAERMIRSWPMCTVYHLRMGAPKADTAEEITPIVRPSSVPLNDAMHIDSNGVVAAGALAGVAAVTKLAKPNSKLWWAPALAAAGVAAFFRDPQRQIVHDPRAVVAASDGRVLEVARVRDERFTDGEIDEWLRISVFLSVLDVHINRAPVAGRVTKIFDEVGGYAMAQKPEAEKNASCYTVLETQRGPAVVAQRTGLIARRIVNRARVNQLLAKGERFGLIRFGSRTDVYLPWEDATPLVVPDERVVAGETLLARW